VATVRFFTLTLKHDITSWWVQQNKAKYSHIKHWQSINQLFMQQTVIKLTYFFYRLVTTVIRLTILLRCHFCHFKVTADIPLTNVSKIRHLSPPTFSIHILFIILPMYQSTTSRHRRQFPVYQWLYSIDQLLTFSHLLYWKNIWEPCSDSIISEFRLTPHVNLVSSTYQLYFLMYLSSHIFY